TGAADSGHRRLSRPQRRAPRDPPPERRAAERPFVRRRDSQALSSTHTASAHTTGVFRDAASRNVEIATTSRGRKNKAYSPLARKRTSGMGYPSSAPSRMATGLEQRRPPNNPFSRLPCHAASGRPRSQPLITLWTLEIWGVPGST